MADKKRDPRVEHAQRLADQAIEDARRSGWLSRPEPAPPASPLRIPLASAEFGPDVLVGGNALARSKPGEHADLALDLTLGCVTFGPHIVPLANVRSMVRA